MSAFLSQIFMALFGKREAQAIRVRPAQSRIARQLRGLK